MEAAGDRGSGVAGDNSVGEHGRHRLHGIVTTVVLIVALLLVMTPGSAAADTGSCVDSGDFEVCFNDPMGPTTPENVIINRLRALVGEAQAGDQIRLAMYSWTLTGLAETLAGAKENGADVQVVVDDRAVGKTPITILEQAGIPVTVCDVSCTSHQNRSIQHNRFYLLDIGGVRKVAITSSNMTRTQETDRYNDLLIVDDDAQLYDFYADYWDRLNAQSWTFAGDTWTEADRERAGRATRAYAFERDDSDVVASILNRVTACRSGDAKIWLSLSKFTAGRAAIQQRLEQLENLGCNVKIIIQRPVDEGFVQKGTSWNLKDPQTYLTRSKVRQMPGSIVDVHHKLMLVDAEYEGRFQEVVFTGSHNFTGPGLRKNDENWVRVEDGFVFSQYRAHFDVLYGRSTD